MTSNKDEILLHDYFDNLLSPDEQKEFEEYLLDNIDLAIELGKLKNLQRNLKNLPSNFSPPDTVIENIINSLLYNEEKVINIDDDLDANQIIIDEDIELEKIIVKKEKKKKVKKERKKFGPESKLLFKKIFYIILGLLFIGALGYGYYNYDTENKTTPWQVSQKNQNVAPMNLEINSILETSKNENLIIKIADKGEIKLSSNSKIKIESGTQSLNSVIFYFGKLAFIPSINNELFEVLHDNINIKSTNSNFTLAGETNNIRINVLTNFVTVSTNDFNWNIATNYEFKILNKNQISIPVNKNSSSNFKNLITSYSISFNEILLRKIITSATLKDALSLHFLLPKVSPEYRELIINKLQKLAPMPQTINKEKILILDQSALDNWWEEIFISLN